jgi:two-component system, sensor histidine kinase PdtaS
VDPATNRTSGRLEAAYIELADRLAEMVAEGSFPFPGGLEGLDSSPRVGDGLLRLDSDGTVLFASPNALSAYRRLGLAADLVGARLDSVTRQLVPRRGPIDEDLAAVASARTARGVEVEGKGTTVQMRAIPLLRAGSRKGGLVLVRDVTELRRRERELLTKDATIREIHHRVKNNLQTVAALLRLQARRMDSADAKAALEEAVRRVGSIAVVHEILSQAVEESVAFDDVADRLGGIVADVGSLGGRLRVRREGSFGELPSETATTVAMVLTELVQNAVEHGYPGLGDEGGTILVTAERTAHRLVFTVDDDGQGLPPGFDVEGSSTLGLSIVGTLVESELGGRLTLGPAPTGRGTRAVIDLPL